MFKLIRELLCFHAYEYELGEGVMECRRCGKRVEK